MANIIFKELGKRTENHNKPKPYLGCRAGHGMPSCYEPNTIYDTPDGKDNFDKGLEHALGKKRLKSFQKGRKFRITYKNGKRHEQRL